jgi:hypothetical protein
MPTTDDLHAAFSSAECVLQAWCDQAALTGFLFVGAHLSERVKAE